jgi:hypothetical protein
MESSSVLIIVLINLFINLLTVLDHFLSRIKKSNCCGSQLEMNDQDNKTNNQLKYIDINELINSLKNLNDKKPDIENKV